MTNNTIHFEVVLEAITYCYSNFNDARDEYYALKECGFNPSLRRVVEGEQTVYWSDRSCAFIG